MTLKDLKKLITAGESAHVEFKTAFLNEAVETIAAFSNASGGTVLVGVADNGQIPGLTLTPETLQQWVNEVKTKTIPSVLPDAEIVTVYGKTVAALHVKEYPVKPVAVKGRYYRRVGNSNHLMRPDEVAQAHYKTRISGLVQQPPQKRLVDGLVDGLVESQKKILILIQAKPNLSKRNLAAAVGISTTAIDKNILVLKAKGLLKRVGPDKGGHWEIK